MGNNEELIRKRSLMEDYLVKLLWIISADASMDLPANYSRMLQNLLRRINSSRPPSYSGIIQLVSYLMQQLEPILGADVIVEHPSERLQQTQGPFSWTSEEVQLVHTGIDDAASSNFIEKLLAIDQAPDLTDAKAARG